MNVENSLSKNKISEFKQSENIVDNIINRKIN